MLPSPSSVHRAKLAEQRVAELFASAGWETDIQPAGPRKADLVTRGPGGSWVVEIKAPTETRPDRVIPQMAQATLQAQTYARVANEVHPFDLFQPLVVLYLETVSATLMKQIEAFADRYMPDTAYGVVTADDFVHFRGSGLEGLNRMPQPLRRTAAAGSAQPFNLFSDLNQWMLKVLLAPDLPPDLLSAPRERYRTGQHLAQAANVSNMSASRLLLQLRREGFLDESSETLHVVRREELMARWRAASMRTTPEQQARFLIRAPAQPQLAKLVSSAGEPACLGLFSAADALGIGHVSGVPSCIYVPRLPTLGQGRWKTLLPAPNGTPDLILRQVPTPQSVFRGAVFRAGVMACDVIQVWLDVSHHPSRGAEQGELIYRECLQPLLQLST